MNTSAVSRSFHTQRNWKMAKDASAGTESGITMLRKIFQFDAPSTRAASIRSRGSVMKKFRLIQLRPLQEVLSALQR